MDTYGLFQKTVLNMGYNAAISYDDVVLDIVKRDGNIEVTPDGDYSVSDDAINEIMMWLRGRCIDGIFNNVWNKCVLLHYFYCCDEVSDSELVCIGYHITDILSSLTGIIHTRCVEKIINPSKLVGYLREWMESHLDLIEMFERECKHPVGVEFKLTDLFYEELVRIWRNDKRNENK